MLEIIVDSSANLTEEQIDKHNFHVVSLSYIVEGREIKNYEKGKNCDYNDFYDRLRKKQHITTSLANTESFMQTMRPLLEAGHDVYYIGMTSGISGTFCAGTLAIKSLRDEFPDRRIEFSDSLSASLGYGILAIKAAELRDSGASIDEVKGWVEDNRLKMCHCFTVDDLFFLRRGGRISDVKAILGSILMLKPILHVDNEGRLSLVTTVKGRKKSVMHLAEQVLEKGVDLKNQTVGIVHGDCIEDALMLKEMIQDSVGDVMINYCDPVLGAHSGPGTMSVFFFADRRDQA